MHSVSVAMKNLVCWIAAPVLICAAVALASGPGDEGPLPDFAGAVAWLNSAPLSSKALRGKVVLVNFWTYSCINSPARAALHEGLGRKI